MALIRNYFLTEIADLAKPNQISNGAYPVRPSPVRGPVYFSKPAEFCEFLPLTGRCGAEV